MASDKETLWVRRKGISRILLRKRSLVLRFRRILEKNLRCHCKLPEAMLRPVASKEKDEDDDGKLSGVTSYFC